MQNNIKVMCWFQFISGIQFIAAVLVPFFTEWGDISFFQLMFLQSWFMMWVLILEIPTGAIADYMGHKRSLMLGSCIGATACLIYIASPHIGFFLCGEFLFALSMSLKSGANEALIYETLLHQNDEHHSLQIFGKLKSIQLTGMLIGAIVGSLIGATLGLRATMGLMSIPLAIATILTFFLTEPPLKNKRKSYRTIVIEGIRYTKNHRIIRILAFNYITVSVQVVLIIWIYQLILKDIGIPLAWFGLIHAGIALTQVWSLRHFNILVRICYGRRSFLLTSAIIGAVGYLSLAIFSTPIVIIPVIVLAFGLALSRDKFLLNYMQKYMHSEMRATISSTINMIRQGTLVFLYPIVGWGINHSFSGTLFLLGVSVTIVAFMSRVAEDHLIDHQPISEDNHA